jgi:hypothetical protein
MISVADDDQPTASSDNLGLAARPGRSGLSKAYSDTACDRSVRTPRPAEVLQAEQPHRSKVRCGASKCPVNGPGIWVYVLPERNLGQVD